jgi:hypothetical protein
MNRWIICVQQQMKEDLCVQQNEQIVTVETTLILF